MSSYRDSRRKSYRERPIVKALTYSKRLFSAGNLPIFLAFLLLLLTVLLKPVNLQRPVYVFQIGFDISQSMNVADMMLNGEMQTRLDYAKAMAEAVLEELPCGSRVGWSVFTDRRTLTLLTPLDVCEHYSGLLAALDGINGTMRWSNGSSIGKGIHQIMRTADEYAEPTAVLFMTDGQEAPPLGQGQKGVPSTEQFDVKGLLVGIGGRTPMPIPKTDMLDNPIGFWSANDVVQRQQPVFAFGGEELSYRDDERLLALARHTQLGYVPLSSAAALIEGAINPEYASSSNVPTDVRWIPASIALLLLLLQFLPRAVDIRTVIRQRSQNRVTITTEVSNKGSN